VSDAGLSAALTVPYLPKPNFHAGTVSFRAKKKNAFIGE
jgi:hypothetical protein